MRLVLFISGKKKGEIKVAGEPRTLFTSKCLLFNYVENLKLVNNEKIAGKDWEIFLYHKSKLNQ